VPPRAQEEAKSTLAFATSVLRTARNYWTRLNEAVADVIGLDSVSAEDNARDLGIDIETASVPDIVDAISRVEGVRNFADTWEKPRDREEALNILRNSPIIGIAAALLVTDIATWGDFVYAFRADAFDVLNALSELFSFDVYSNGETKILIEGIDWRDIRGYIHELLPNRRAVTLKIHLGTTSLNIEEVGVMRDFLMLFIYPDMQRNLLWKVPDEFLPYVRVLDDSRNVPNFMNLSYLENLSKDVKTQLDFYIKEYELRWKEIIEIRDIRSYFETRSVGARSV